MQGLIQPNEAVEDKFSCVERLYQKNLFSSTTYFFLKNMLTEDVTEDAYLAMGYLLEISFLGYLSLEVKNNKLYPSFLYLFLQKQIVIEASLAEEMEKRVLCGLGQIPDVFLQKIQDTQSFAHTFFCQKENKFYLQRNYMYETICLANLQRKQENNSCLLNNNSLEDAVQKYRKESKLLPCQAEAIVKSLQNTISFICGGPGCGKTYTIFYLMTVFLSSWTKDRQPLIILTAPTGKATQKLEELLQKKDFTNADIQIVTLHSLLKMRKEEGVYFTNKTIDADLIIVDESSMIDIRLMAYLLQATPAMAKLIMVGDPYQLPPIETQSFFSICAKENLPKIPVSFLTQAMRFESSTLQDLAHMVITQKKEAFFALCEEKSSTFTFIDMDVMQEKEIFEKILEIAKDYYTPSQAPLENILQSLQSFHIISALRKGRLGANNINHELKQYFVDRVDNTSQWYLPIMITKNDYQQKLYNGTIGLLVGKKEKKSAYFLRNNIIEKIPLFHLPSYESSFCLSVHKSQGSEFDHVLLIIPPGSEAFSKEMLYTAITRAKKKLTMLASKETLQWIFSKGEPV